MNEFDRRTFIDNLRATKPPYECPYSKCGRVYKSFSGIQSHIMNVAHEPENDEARQGGSSTRSCGDQLTSQPNQKIVEYESLMDGKFCKVNVLEPLEVSSSESTTVMFINTDSAAKPNKSIREIIESIPAEATALNSPKTSPVNILEPNFRILEEFTPNKAPPMPQSYIKYIEMPIEELEEEIEYDMDEEDYVWLSLMNEKRQKHDLCRVSKSVLENVMDFFEKNCHFATSGRNPNNRSPGGRDQPQLFDEDAVCCVCLDGECDNANAILFCDMCNLSVHQECYGVPYIPEGQWLCRCCQLSPSQAVSCVLCPNKGGAFKQTSDGRWAHVTCAIWVPEVQFANTVFLEPIEGFERIPPARWKLVCYVCKQKRSSGACIQCHKPSCYTAFHVTCAQSAGLFMKIEPVKDVSPGGTQYGVRKTAFCDSHEPSNEENENRSGNPGYVRARTQRREEAKARIRRARRLLNQSRNSSPSVSIPVVPKSKLQEIASELKLSGKNEFLERLLCYWTLKRQSRFGVPLLRRLQVCQQRRNLPIQDKIDNTIDVASQIKYWKQVRRDLEKTRLLVELLRKREQRKREQRKKDVVVTSLNIAEVCLKPLRQCLINSVEKLLEQDEMLVFAKPVSDYEVPGYSSFIQHPMDIGTMAQKAKRGDYFDVRDLQADFDLMISNCLKFNRKNPFFVKYAQKMRKACNEVWIESQREYEEACRKVSTVISACKKEQEEACKIDGSTSAVKLTENFQEYIDERAKRQEKSKKAMNLTNSRRILQSSRGRYAKNAVMKMRGQSDMKPKRLAGLANRSSKQQDIRNFFALNKTVTTPETNGEAKNSSLVEEEDEEGPLVRLTGKACIGSKSPKKTATGSPPRSQQKSPGNKSIVSPNRDKSGDSFRTFRYVSATSPGGSSDAEKFRDRNRSSSLFCSSAMQFKDASKSSTLRAADPCNDHSDSDRDDECAKKVEAERVDNFHSVPATGNRDLPVTRSIIDVLLEHMDIVWAFSPDYPYYFPGVVIDPCSSDYPPSIPRPPKEMCKKQEIGSSSSNSSKHYLIYLFDHKPTWRWLENSLVEPMFVDNDLDRRKLLAATKKANEKLLKKAYKTAVDFRCSNTGEEPEEFSIIDGTLSIYDDSDDSSS